MNLTAIKLKTTYSRFMKRRNIVIGGAAAVAIVLGGLVFSLNKSDKALNTNAQANSTPSQTVEQKNEQAAREQENVAMQPKINDEEFTLVGSNVNCSTTEVNGAVSRSCSGNIHIIPKANQEISAGLYKINEQTKLLHNGQEQELTSLQQLSQSQTVIKLTLVDGSEEMLAEIRY